MNIDELEVIDSITSEDGTKVEVVQFKELKGSANIQVAEKLFFAKEVGIRLKMVRVILNNSKGARRTRLALFHEGQPEDAGQHRRGRHAGIGAESGFGRDFLRQRDRRQRGDLF